MGMIYSQNPIFLTRGGVQDLHDRSDFAITAEPLKGSYHSMDRLVQFADQADRLLRQLALKMP